MTPERRDARRVALAILLILAGAVTWIVAANVDRIMNMGDLLGVGLIVAGIALWTSTTSR